MLFFVVCFFAATILLESLACLGVFVEEVKAKKKDSQRHCWLSIVTPVLTVERKRQVLLPTQAT